MTPLQALIAQLPRDPDAKGRAFERLVKWFLENDPRYKALLKRVHHWKSSPHRWGRDTGIDLTAEAHDGTLWAIQAKAYGSDHYVTKHDVDKFLSESGRRPVGRRAFDVRLLVATTDYLGANARAVLDNTPGCHRLLLGDLENAPVVWPRTLENLEPARARRAIPKPHQRVAVRDVVAGLRRASRGQLLMACGTGKTLTALWVVERLKARRVLVLLPSLSLVRQTLAAWYAHGKYAPPYQVVCSDESVHKGEDGDDLVTTSAELPYPVTTDPRVVASFLKGQGHRYVFSTYHSSPVIAAAFKHDRRLPIFDMVVADEAHRITGTPDAAFATVLANDEIKAKRRLFMTATPRYATRRLRKEAHDADIELASMDDEVRFGRVLHKLTFSTAIRRKLLTDYQVAVVVVDDETYRGHAVGGRFVTIHGKLIDARMIACQLGLARAMRKFDLRKVVSFHSRVAWASTFASSFRATVSLMPGGIRPSGDLWCRHVFGAQATRDRDAVLTELKQLGDTQRGLVANARCLTEGVDVPALDGVVFVDPRRSEVDVVQAVGRAIRKAADKKIGTIVVPVFVGERVNAVEALETSAFQPVWQVIQALRAHDDVLGTLLDELRHERGRRGTSGRLPTKIKVIAATELEKEFLSAFDARLVENTTASWEFWHGLLEAFAAKHGHANVPGSHVTKDGWKLGSWVGVQRSKRSQLSPERIRRLERVNGWSWKPQVDAWESGFRHLIQFVSEYGHARVRGSYVAADGYKLGSWVNNQRGTKDRLSPQRIKRLERVSGWSWDAIAAAWADGLLHLRKFVERYGHARVPGDHVDANGFKLGVWVTTQRAFRRRGQLSPAKIAALENVDGWAWNPHRDAWETGFRHLVEFIEREGHGLVPSAYVTPSGFKLGKWVTVQRHTRSRHSADRLKRLEELRHWTWDPHADVWERAFDHLQAFARRERHAVVPVSYVVDGFRLGGWVVTQRSHKKLGRLSRERVRRLSRVPGWRWSVR